MTSEPDNKPGRRPPTIELTATEVDQPASSQGNGGTAEGTGPDAGHSNGGGGNGSSTGRWTAHAASGLAGAVVMAMIGAALWYAGFVPGHETTATNREIATPPVAPAPRAALSDDISARLDKIEAALKAPRPDTALGDRLAATDAQAKSLGDSVAAVRRRVDDVAVTAQTAQKAADAAAATADAAKSAGSDAIKRSDLEAVTKRMVALEGAVNTLAEQVAQHTSAADDRAVRLTIVAAALRDAGERGAPYQAELAAVKSLGAAQSATARLEPFAATGIPSALTLARELEKMIPDLQRASDPTPDETTFLGKLEAHARKLVRVTPVGEPVGNDPRDVLARIDSAAARGDLAAALHDIAALPDNAKTPVGAWVKKAQAREAAIAAARQIAADALAALGKTATQ